MKLLYNEGKKVNTYDQLVSGTDIRAVAMGNNIELTNEVAEKIGQSFAVWLNHKHVFSTNESQKVIAIGRDSRLSGEELLHAFANGLTKQGFHVLNFGLCTTPAMYKCLSGDQPVAHASVMVTASHHPWDRNGFKFFTPDGGINADELKEIISFMEMKHETSMRHEYIENYDYLSFYIQELKDVVREKLDDDVSRPLLGLHVLVDAGNGAGGFYAKLLEDLGAATEGSQFLEPDGHFPNHSPNPEDAEAMKSISEAVTKHTADLGIIFDTDCDRAALVDHTGLAINRNRLIALVSAMLLNEEPGLTIVTDSVTSSGLSKLIGAWGGEHYRYKRGYRNVIDEAKRLNDIGVNCPLAIETSGHAALRENQFLDDGMYLSTLLVCESMRLKREGKYISSLLEGLKEPEESLELRLKIYGEDHRENGMKVIETIMDYASEAEGWEIAPDNREGVRIAFDLHQKLDNAWFLMRLSVHDPVLALNVESDVKGGLQTILTELLGVIAHLEGVVDMSPISNYINNNQTIL